ncbi:MAG: xylulokinase [Thermomicrobiales bacterium]|nr:xylulokinase [Thermomicrobiales bacterium]
MNEVVLGIDSSTQSTKAVALDLATGAIVAEGRAPHSGADTQWPGDWWEALRLAVEPIVQTGLKVAGISVAGQQHGLVTADINGNPTRPAPLWNNTDAAPDAERLNQLADFAAETGTRLVASITIAKVAHLARTAPDALESIGAICLPHDWLTWKLTGVLTTDRGDASGSGWWSPITESTRRHLLELATGVGFAARIQLPEVLGPNDCAGMLTRVAASFLGLTPGIPVAVGTGDNMGAALGIGAAPGHYVVSLGTSGTAYAVSDEPTADPTGEVCGFADATGRYLPLACMLNCTRVVDSVAAATGQTLVQALDRAGTLEPGADGLLLMPYLAGERTPNLPHATGSFHGVTTSNLDPGRMARAAVDGVAAGLAYCIDALRRLTIEAPGIVLVGGGSAHATWQQAIADAVQLPVTVLGGKEHVAFGAAIQAAAVAMGASVVELSGRWRPPVVTTAQPRPEFAQRFRLDERQALIDAERARVAISPSA